MNRWTVKDRQNREVYMTRERWEHIITKHSELRGRREEVLRTVREGKRRQTKRDPQTYCYQMKSQNLPKPYNKILVFVAFRYQHGEEPSENNFVTTAWGEVASISYK